MCIDWPVHFVGISYFDNFWKQCHFYSLVRMAEKHEISFSVCAPKCVSFTCYSVILFETRSRYWTCVRLSVGNEESNSFNVSSDSAKFTIYVFSRDFLSSIIRLRCIFSTVKTMVCMKNDNLSVKVGTKSIWIKN